jgi:hypothetical protein
VLDQIRALGRTGPARDRLGVKRGDYRKSFLPTQGHERVVAVFSAINRKGSAVRRRQLFAGRSIGGIKIGQYLIPLGQPVAGKARVASVGRITRVAGGHEAPNGVFLPAHFFHDLGQSGSVLASEHGHHLGRLAALARRGDSPRLGSPFAPGRVLGVGGILSHLGGCERALGRA